MKFTLLAFLILAFTSLSSIAQQPLKSQFKLDALDFQITAPRLSYPIPDSLHKNKLYNNKGIYEYLKTPELNKEEKDSNTDWLEFKTRENTTYNMPCYKPVISDEMPVFVPDSTILYSLLILEK